MSDTKTKNAAEQMAEELFNTIRVSLGHFLIGGTVPHLGDEAWMKGVLVARKKVIDVLNKGDLQTAALAIASILIEMVDQLAESDGCTHVAMATGDQVAQLIKDSINRGEKIDATRKDVN